MKYLIILIVLASCNPLKKATKTFRDNPEAAALFCAVNFPSKDSIITGDTVTTVDTVYQGEIVEVQVAGDTVTIKLPCPPTKIITKTLVRIDTIVRVDHAKETVLQNTIADRDKTIGEQAITINRVQGEFDGMKDKRNWWRTVAFILGGVLGLGVFLKIKRII